MTLGWTWPSAKRTARARETGAAEKCAALASSFGIVRIPGIETFLSVDVVTSFRGYASAERLMRMFRADAKSCFAVGWGNKPKAMRLKAWAMQRGYPYLSLEDGFLRSPGRIGDSAPPLSIVVDDCGVHYAPDEPSRIETILATHDFAADQELMARARTCRERLLALGLSKYNGGETMVPPPHVLVLGQTPGDASLQWGAPGQTALDLVRLAAAENPGARVVYRLHPSVVAGRHEPPLDLAEIRRYAAVDDCTVSLHAAFGAATRVYTATSLAGFEAVLRGIPVTVTGGPFYAGWGLTDDRRTFPRRGRQLSVDEAFAGAYLLYARYVCPWTRERIELERALDVLEAMNHQRTLGDKPSVLAGIREWKRQRVSNFLDNGQGRHPMAVEASEATEAARRADGRVVAWASSIPSGLAEACAAADVELLHAEDGFLRSQGLGAALTFPLSLTFDRQRPYYDSRGPSDLEGILSERRFSDWETARARRLIDVMVRNRLGKYGADAADAPLDGDSAVLVLGQVEDDASVQFGTCSVNSNGDLLRRVRDLRPEARIVYRPHPDVRQGLRKGEVPASLLAALTIEEDTGPFPAAISAAHEVHTMTSLGGLEALMRGRCVVCHGWPFYAGWGLTEDVDSVSPDGLAMRRSRRLTLEELVAGVYFQYAYYFDPVSKLPCDPFTVARRMLEGQASEAAPRIVRHAWMKWRRWRHAAAVLFA